MPASRRSRPRPARRSRRRLTRRAIAPRADGGQGARRRVRVRGPDLRAHTLRRPRPTLAYTREGARDLEAVPAPRLPRACVPDIDRDDVRARPLCEHGDAGLDLAGGTARTVDDVARDLPVLKLFHHGGERVTPAAAAGAPRCRPTQELDRPGDHLTVAALADHDDRTKAGEVADPGVEALVPAREHDPPAGCEVGMQGFLALHTDAQRARMTTQRRHRDTQHRLAGEPARRSHGEMNRREHHLLRLRAPQPQLARSDQAAPGRSRSGATRRGGDQRTSHPEGVVGRLWPRRERE